MLVPALLGLVQFLLLVQPPSTHLHPQPGVNNCAWSEQLCRLSVDKCLCRCLGVCLPGIVSLHGEDFAILSISVPSSWHRMSRRSWDPGQRAGGWAGCCHPLPTQKNREGLSPCPRPWPQPQPQEVSPQPSGVETAEPLSQAQPPLLPAPATSPLMQPHYPPALEPCLFKMLSISFYPQGSC